MDQPVNTIVSNDKPKKTMGYAWRVLIAEDEKNLRDLLSLSLSKTGYIVKTVADGVELLEVMNEFKPDIILLDIMMPRMDGFAALQKIRRSSDVPVAMLTALGNVEDVVTGFELGADDYITKPFTFKEVRVRLEAIMRRIAWAKNPPTPTAVTIGDVTLDNETHEVTLRGKTVELTPIEFQLLQYLMAHPGQPVSKETLFRDVWGYEFVGGTNLVEVGIRRLRTKIEEEPSRPYYIRTVRGIGYTFKVPD